MTAYFRGQAARAAGSPMKVFDWDKAARIIKEKKPEHAEAGLIEDWSSTGGMIYNNGKPVPEEDTYVYLASIWATPTLILNHWDEEIECWVYQSEKPEWNERTYWPESALKILEGGD